jgi:hypothetical protein
MRSNNLMLLEDGYNTSYIYAVITAVFYKPCEITSSLLTTTPPTIDAYYIQDFIKSKFVYQFAKGYIIDAVTINKFRMLMYNNGWLKNQKLNILTKANAEGFFIDLISNQLNNKLHILKYNIDTNNFVVDMCNMIKISNSIINNKQNRKNIVSITDLLNTWCTTYFAENISWKFEKLPLLIPIFLDIKNPKTGVNKCMINIMHSISFPQICEGMQRKLIWDMHSLICRTNDGNYYSVVSADDNELVMISDKDIPSNTIIDVKNPEIVKKIMREVSVILYRLH